MMTVKHSITFYWRSHPNIEMSLTDYKPEFQCYYAPGIKMLILMFKKAENPQRREVLNWGSPMKM